MSMSKKPLIALMATALAATVGYAVAQDASTTTTTDSSATNMTMGQPGSTTTTEVQTVTIPGRTTGVIPSNPPGTYTAVPGSVEPNSVMTTGVNFGSTRINVGDHATPMLPGKPEVLSVTSQTTTTTVPPAEVAQAPAPAPEPAPAVQTESAPEAAAPMPAPRSDRN